MVLACFAGWKMKIEFKIIFKMNLISVPSNLLAAGNKLGELGQGLKSIQSIFWIYSFTLLFHQNYIFPELKDPESANLRFYVTTAAILATITSFT